MPPRLIHLICLCVMFAILPVSTFSQDYSWWNRKHNWDGVTHWTRYLIISPAFLGPNAMPVPVLRGGSLDTSLLAQIAADVHRSIGDQTENLYTSLHIPVAKGVAALKLEMVVWEQYRMDTLTRDARRARDEDGKGQSIGDLQVSSLIRISRNHKLLPDMNLGVHIRTATGSNKSAARFSDSPGYFFDLNMSKRFIINHKTQLYLEPRGMLGFYAWQVNRDDNLQDDALLYGLGLHLGTEKTKAGIDWAGYHGYFDNGDRPMVIRIHASRKIAPKTQIFCMLQQGVHDFAYTSVRMGLSLCFSTPQLFRKSDQVQNIMH